MRIRPGSVGRIGRLGGRRSGSSDVAPDPYAFTDVSEATGSSIYESNTITTTGISDVAAVSITGGEYAKWVSGAWSSWTSSVGTAVNGDQFKVRGTASSTPSAVVNVVLSIGTGSDTFSITTASGAPPATLPSTISNAQFAPHTLEPMFQRVGDRLLFSFVEPAGDTKVGMIDLDTAALEQPLHTSFNSGGDDHNAQAGMQLSVSGNPFFLGTKHNASTSMFYSLWNGTTWTDGTAFTDATNLSYMQMFEIATNELIGLYRSNNANWTYRKSTVSGGVPGTWTATTAYSQSGGQHYWAWRKDPDGTKLWGITWDQPDNVGSNRLYMAEYGCASGLFSANSLTLTLPQTISGLPILLQLPMNDTSYTTPAMQVRPCDMTPDGNMILGIGYFTSDVANTARYFVYEWDGVGPKYVRFSWKLRWLADAAYPFGDPAESNATYNGGGWFDRRSKGGKVGVYLTLPSTVQGLPQVLEYWEADDIDELADSPTRSVLYTATGTDMVVRPVSPNDADTRLPVAFLTMTDYTDAGFEMVTPVLRWANDLTPTSVPHVTTSNVVFCASGAALNLTLDVTGGTAPYTADISATSLDGSHFTLDDSGADPVLDWAGGAKTFDAHDNHHASFAARYGRYEVVVHIRDANGLSCWWNGTVVGTTATSGTAWTYADAGGEYADVYDPDTLADGLVSSFPSTTNAVALTATTTARPTKASSVLNGKASILFDGVANKLRAASGISALLGSANEHVFVLMQPDLSRTGLQVAFSMGANSASNSIRVGFDNETATDTDIGAYFYRGTSRVDRRTSAGGVIGAYYATANGAQQLLVDGEGIERLGGTSTKQTDAATTIATLVACMGNTPSASGSSWFKGHVYLVVLMKGASIPNMLRVMGKAYHDYGIASQLAADHPFRNNRPYT